MSVDGRRNPRQGSIPLRCIVDNGHRRRIGRKAWNGPQNLGRNRRIQGAAKPSKKAQEKKRIEKTCFHTEKLKFRRDEFNKKKAAFPRLLSK
jgi:hypothetical protein